MRRILYAARRSIGVAERRGLRLDHGTMRTVVRRALRSGMRLALPQKRLENLSQRPAPAQNSRFHCPHAALEDLRHFLVTQSFQIAQNDRGAKYIRNFLQSALHGDLNFARSELLERRGTEILDFNRRVTLLGRRVNRNIFL